MRGKGKSIRHPLSRTFSTLKRCNNNGEADDVVLIDVDSDTLNNVIIIDVPDTLKQKLRGSTVIYIDDDENSDKNHPRMGVESGGKFYDGASSSRTFPPAFNCTRKSVNADSDEREFVREKFSPLKLSKCKRTYSGKASSRNRYGLGPELDNSGSSDNDCPDCEVMEDTFGKLREEWEKANLKKKFDVCNSKSGKSDQATTSGLHAGSTQNVEVENLTGQHVGAQVSPSSSNVRCEEESPSSFVQTGDGVSGSTFNSSKKTPFADFGLDSTPETQFSNSKANNWDRGEAFPVVPPFKHAEGQPNKNAEQVGSSFLHEEDQCCQGPSLGLSHERGNKQQINNTKMFSQHEERTSSVEPCLSNPEPTVDLNFGDTRSGFNSRAPNESDNASSSSRDEEHLVSGESSSPDIQLCDETQVNKGVANNEVGAIPEEIFCEVPSLGKSGIEKEKGCFQENEVHIEPIIGSRKLFGEMSSNQQQEEKDVPFHCQDGDFTNAVGSLINEREKLKETDEYKRAVEEEWASRQRELKLQAEEAQRLRRMRKRKNAESMRLLDMERRQKQRVEEMRETQKKDEENLNTKEQLRAEVRKELKKLELTCPDMASLLRGLGIQVGGGLQPAPHEVRAGYKRALLSFHPDRASGSDIRKLVEAEEKFKLISRMKDKFFKTS